MKPRPALPEGKEGMISGEKLRSGADSWLVEHGVRAGRCYSGRAYSFFRA
jgi:hypothetical protein